MKITGIYIYPIKSMGGIRLETATVEREGLQHDRRWMLLDANDQFITQRQVPELALIQGSLSNAGILLSHKNGQHGQVELPFDEEPDSPPFPVKVWSDEVAARAVSGTVNEWLSDALKTRCGLVKIETNAMRYSLKGKGGKYVSFADTHPLLLAGSASLYELNSRMETPLPMTRFRPNLVFDGGKPFEEDTWKAFSIGQVQFKNMGLCDRCKVTLIDPETGKTTGAEPLRTMDTFRKMDGKVFFGVWGTLLREDEKATIRVGDLISGN